MSDLGATRAAVVREHMESENRLDFDATIATFAHPRYELIGTGQVFDGEEEVRGYFATSRAAFPDQRNELHALHVADDAVIVEFDLLGTHLGDFIGIAPTGRDVPLPDDRRVRVHRRPHHLRAGLLRPGRHPAPARPRRLTIRPNPFPKVRPPYYESRDLQTRSVCAHAFPLSMVKL